MSALTDLIKNSPELQRATADVREREEREERVKRAENDFQFFCSYYLPDYFFCPLAPYQKILNSIAETKSITDKQAYELKQLVPLDFAVTIKPQEKLRLLLDVEPRGHGKSTRWTFAFALWCALYRKYMFLIIIGATNDEASLHMENLRLAIESNERITADFGYQAGSPWNKNDLNFKSGVRVIAKGKGGSLRGKRNKQYRPDLILVDDLFKDDEAESQRERDKIWNWFNKTVLPLGKDAFFILVNTITNEDDVASRILKKIEKEKPEAWTALRFSAETHDEIPLWAERYTWADLKRIEKEIGSTAYSQEYLGRAISDEDRMFKKEWIVRVERAQIPEKLLRYEGIDPATGAHDLSAVVDIGRERGGALVYVVGSNGKKESTVTFKERLITHYKTYRYKKAYMESVAFQEVYRKEIIETAARKKLSLPIKGYKPGRASKEVRNMAMQPLIENGTVVFGPGNQELIDQLLVFPHGSYDDLVDALYYALCAAGYIKGRVDDGEGTIVAASKKNGMELRRKLKI